MNLTARLKGETIEIFNVMNGSIVRAHQLPPGKYSNLIVSGDNVTVTITPTYGRDRIRTINLKTGAIASEIQM